ncbi:MAG: DUF1295 domain-containing protein [Pseudomonadota bacterium]
MMNDLIFLWMISLGGFLILWPISLWRRDASVVDFWWGPGVGAMVLVAGLQHDVPFQGVAVLLMALTVLWAMRLGVHLGLRRLAEGEEDGRYAEMREAWSPGWGWKSLFVVFLLQSVLQGIMALPILVAILKEAPVDLSVFSIIAAGIALFGIALQTKADLELDRYRAEHGHGTLYTGGLRALVRHPNYLGEILVWAGLSALAFELGVLWAPLSLALVTVLLCYVSGITILDGRFMRTRPETYPDYRARVPALIPRREDLMALFGGSRRSGTDGP